MKNVQKVNLKKRLENIDIQSLNGWVSITTQTINEKNLNELAVISELLEKVGITLEITKNENTGLGLDYDFITMKVNEEKYKAAMSRHAGRKADFNKKYDKYGKCTVEELQEKLEHMPKTKIAEELGCPRMTLYRIMKNIENRKPEGSMSIWHFTS